MTNKLLLGAVLVLVFFAPCRAAETLYAGKPLAFWLAGLKDSDPLIREEAIAVLSDAGPAAREAVPQLEALLKDEQRGVRFRAGLALWRIAGQKKPAIAALTEALRDPARTDRVNLLYMLADFGPDAISGAPAVLELAGDAEPVLHGQAALLLRRFGPGVVTVLTAALEGKDTRQRRNAAEVLGRMGSFGREAQPALLRRLGDEDKRVRIACARALWSQGQTTEAVAAVLLEAARTGDTAQRRDILDTIGQGTGSKLAPPILKALLRTDDLLTRVRAANALWDLDPQPELVLPIFLQGIKDRDFRIRNPSAQGLIRVGRAAREAVPALIEIVKAPTGNFGNEVYEALGRLDAPGLPSVVSLLDHEDRRLRNVGCQAVTALGPAAASAVPKLIPLLKDEDPGVRRAAVQALGRIGTAARPATEALVELARDKNDPIRLQSLMALESIRPDPRLVQPVAVEALKDRNVQIRIRGANLLFTVAPKHADVLPTALDLLKQPAGSAAAIELLGRMGPAAAGGVPALTKMLADRNANVRLSVIYALGRIGPPAKSAVPALLKQLNDPDPTIGYGALKTLRVLGGDDSARAVPAVLAAAKRNANLYRVSCLDLLGDHGPKAAAAVPWLVEELHRPPSNLTPNLAEALFKIDPERARKEAPAVLREMLKASSPSRVQAAALLLRIKPDSKEGLDLLIDSSQATDAGTRQQAILALGQLGSSAHSAVPALRQSLRDPTILVRIYAAGSLWMIARQAEDTLPVLMEALKQTSAGVSVRQQAAARLMLMGPAAKAALPDLLKLRDDADPALRNWITDAIKRIDPPTPAAPDKSGAER
jgi:HEAT repeat protein